jgi:hypothetical protein
VVLKEKMQHIETEREGEEKIIFALKFNLMLLSGSIFTSVQFLPIVCLRTNYCYGFLYELQFLHVALPVQIG